MRYQDIYERPIVKEKLAGELLKRLQTSEVKEGKEFVNLLASDLAKVVGEDVVERLHDALDRVESSDFESAQAFQENVVDKVLDFMKANVPYDVFEQHQRDVFHSQGGFEKLNDILSFGSYKDVAHIHLAPARTMSPDQLIVSIQDGLHVLAQRLQTDSEFESIERVTGTSWIVAKRPEMLEALGFTIDGPISDEMRTAHFSEDGDTPISQASMSREDFLKRYGK